MESVRKSNEVSAVLRAEGNQFYAQKDFYNALLKYNESLCRAESGSENLGLAYANRSAVYFEMKLFDECIVNIGLARQNHYPETSNEILNKRHDKCVELMRQLKPEAKASTQKIFSLSYPSHEAVPFIADCLDLKTDKQYGRHISTSRQLKVGDVIAVEKPFCKIIRGQFVYQRCAGCFGDFLLNLLPCSSCQRAMFCSNCKGTEETSGFHQFECPLMEVLISSALTPTFLMAMRTLFFGLSLFDGSIEGLEKFINDNACRPITIFDCKDPTDLKQRLLAVHSLISSDKVEVKDSVFQDFFVCALTLQPLWSANSSFIRNFLRKQSQIGTMNYHEIYGWPLTKAGIADPEIDHLKDSLAYKRGVVSMGNGSFPFCSLINHSCSPNVCRYYYEDKTVLVVIRGIERGEQLFDNYGYSFTNMPKDYRQTTLLKQYKFKCTCKACEKNWPLLPGLKVADKATFNRAKKACREISSSSFSQKKALEKFRELCEIISRGQKSFPCVEICSLMETATAFFETSMRPSVQFP